MLLHVVAALPTSHKVGLAVVAVVFIGFALFSSFVAPRIWPDFPGEHGLSVFIIASLALFAAMLAAVLIFGKEPKESGKSGLSGARIAHVASHLRL